jgi:aryl-alcohol dehydrogenase-like predicted oxidoreductase
VDADQLAEAQAIAGTSTVAHLRQNLASAALPLDKETLAELDAIGA